MESASNIGWTLADHILATFLRTAIGLVLGGIFGITVGLLVQFSSVAQRLILPFLDMMRPVPVIALLPLFILIFGFSEIGRMVLIVINTAVFLAIATIEAVSKVPEQWVRFARISGLSKGSVFRKVLMPAIMPFLIGPARLALALAFTVTIAAEFMGAQVGLGYLINTARVNLAIPTVWLAILALGALSQLLDILLVSVSHDLTRWYRGTEE
jgi:ABC-type nitrate/sulfonate/bicarbonate transport system permease component